MFADTEQRQRRFNLLSPSGQPVLFLEVLPLWHQGVAVGARNLKFYTEVRLCCKCLKGCFIFSFDSNKFNSNSFHTTRPRLSLLNHQSQLGQFRSRFY